MKKSTLTLISFLVIIMTSCEKDEITPSKPDPKEKLIECRMCDGHWDLTADTIP